MATNFEIIINLDAPVILASGKEHRFNIDEVISILENHNCIYTCAPHIPDEMSSFNHWHCGFHTTSDNTFETIAKWFDLPVNAIQRIKGQFKSTYALYVIHYNKEGKTPVPIDQVRYNWQLDYDKLIKNVSQTKRLDDILSQIDNGIIKPYNYTSYINLDEYTKYKRYIDNAFAYRIDRLKGIDRKMECVFITGDSGVGKTTYAKQVASDKGYMPYISSGSNDVLDDYQGQECIILDDLRPSCMSLSDLLKMLDNNTASTVKSRFRNKCLECKLIVITSTLKIDDFFSQVFSDQPETAVQLKRRCRVYIQMTKTNMFISIYNNLTRDYEQISVMPNVILEQFKELEKMSDEDKVKLVCDILGGSADMFSKLKKGIEDKSFLPAEDISF